jgi:hypothetical protein
MMLVKDQKYGFANKKGEVVIPIAYDYSKNFKSTILFKNGFAVAEKNKKQWLMDTTERYIAAKGFERIEPFSEGLAAIQKKGKWGYINAAEKIQIPCIYQSAGYFKNDLAKVTKKDQVGFINKKGKMMIDFMYDEATDFNAFGKNWSLVSRLGKVGIIDMMGNELIPCEMDEIKQEDTHLLRIEKDATVSYYDMQTANYLWKEPALEL